MEFPLLLAGLHLLTPLLRPCHPPRFPRDMSSAKAASGLARVRFWTRAGYVFSVSSSAVLSMDSPLDSATAWSAVSGFPAASVNLLGPPGALCAAIERIKSGNGRDTTGVVPLPVRVRFLSW